MSIHIYSDPHIGKTLASHTTADSRKRLREYIAIHTAQVVDSFPEGETILCAGDFFHSHQNTEDVLHSSLWTASQTSKILAGNHDVVNIRDRKGTLDIVGTVFDMRVVPCKFGMLNYQVVVSDLPNGALIYMVPHHSSQELFEDVLETVMKSAEKESRPCYLVTHCNYNSEFINDTVTLHMTQRMADRLLKAFDRIVLGHEHNFKTDFDERVIVIGSPHPTDFGDISDKFVLTIHDDGSVEYIKVWDRETHYLECDWRDLPTKMHPEHQWVKLVGEIPASDIHDLAGMISETWKHFDPFTIRSEVQILSGDTSMSDLKPMSMDRISEIIEEELKSSPDLYELWRAINDPGTASE